MSFKSIRMKSIARNIIYPYPCSCFGWTENSRSMDQEYVYTDRIEFCLRLKDPASPDLTACDWIDGTLYQTELPHVFIKRPMKKIHSVIPEHRHALFIIYDSKTIPALKQCAFLKENEFFWKFDSFPLLQGLISELKSLADLVEHKGCADRIDQLCFQLLTECFIKAHTPSDPLHIQDNEKIRKAASFLRLHFTEVLDMDTIAEVSTFSRRTFYRKWKQVFTISPLQYLTELRLVEARKLLLESDLSIGSVAKKLSFCDEVHFIKIFRSRYQMTPFQFRKRFAPWKKKSGSQ